MEVEAHQIGKLISAQIEAYKRIARAHFWGTFGGEKFEAKMVKARDQRGGDHSSSSNPSSLFLFSMFSFDLWMVIPSIMF